MNNTSHPEPPGAPLPADSRPPPAVNNPTPCTPDSVLPTDSDPQPSTLNSQPTFPRCPGETPRAYSAYMTFFQLGHSRSLQTVADKLGQDPGTVRNWSSRFDWSGRIQAFNADLLQQQAQTQAAANARQAADWAARLDRFREQEWDAAQKLLLAAQCYLESFGEDDLRKMTLAQVSRALKISSAIGRLALAGAELPEACGPALSPVQQQLLDAMRRVYGQASQSSSSSSSSITPSQPSTLNSQPL